MPIQRTILWVVFSMSLLYLWDNWQKSNGKPSMFGGQPVATTPAGAEGKPDASVPTASSSTAGAVPSASAAAGASAVPGGVSGAAAPAADLAPLSLRSDRLLLQISPMGGQVTRAELITQKATPGAPEKSAEGGVVLLQQDPGRLYVAQSGLIGAPQGESYPTHKTRFAPVGESVSKPDGSAELKLVAESGGVKLERTYRIAAGSYAVEVSDKLTNTTGSTIKPTLYLQLTRDDHKPAGESQFYSTYTGPAVYDAATKFHKVDFGDIEKGKADKIDFAKQTSDGWVGIIQHYFVAAWIPADKAARENFARKVDTNTYAIGTLQSLGEVAAGASTAVSSRLLIAPQDQEMLATVSPGLELAVDYGWLTVVAKPIFALLQWLHGLVGNWGWSIILLTIVIKTLFFPLQAASYKSMARMKAVTPRLQALRERYGNDRVKLNQAMMELYKEEKINPLGGCLPIVVQIPVFIALYWVLLASVEMRHAPWIGWIEDLAAPDALFGTLPLLNMPVGLLPLVMAATMFLQVRLNPTPPDPVQAKVMMIMPLVFSFMFFFFPAGLVLYWTVNNVYSIAQQWTINRAFEGGKGKSESKPKSKKA